MKKTMLRWGVSRQDAEVMVTSLYWDSNNEAALSFAKAAMPTWQRETENTARIVADAIAFGVVSPLAIARIREALAEYDAERAKQREGNDDNG